MSATEKNPTILCIETSQHITSVAISHSGNCTALKEIHQPNQAGEQLHVLINQLLESSGLKFDDLNAIAISGGPGSYTGLRIAAATAKGYCYALGIPLIAIPTLTAMTAGIVNRYHQTATEVLVPMIDARRMEVFTAFYDRQCNQLQSFSSFIINEDTGTIFDANSTYLLFGSGASKAFNFLKLDHVHLMEEFIHSASDLCGLAQSKFDKHQFEDIAYYEPDYAKPFYTTAIKQNQ